LIPKYFRWNVKRSNIPCHLSMRHLDCICSTCLSIFRKRHRGGLLAAEGACSYGWTGSLPRFFALVSYTSRKSPQANRNQVQLSRGGFWTREKFASSCFAGGCLLLAVVCDVTLRFYLSLLLGQTKRMKTYATREREREEGGEARIACSAHMQIRDVRISRRG